MQTTDSIENAVDSLLAPQHTETQETADEALVQDEEVETEAEVDPQEYEEAEAEEEVEASDEDVEDDDTETDPESDTDEDEEESEDDEAPQLFTVKVDGEEKQVTLDDLKRDYSGQAYIQKGMQEAAAMRKEAESIFQTLQNERQQFFATLQQVQEQGMMNPPEAPNPELLDKDPIKYMQEDARYKAKLGEYQQQQMMLQQELQRQQALEQQARQVRLQEEAQVLYERIPELADPEKGSKLKQSIVETAMNAYGFNADEMSQVIDRRQVEVLYDAYRWRELQKGKQQAKKKPAAPKNVKPKPRRAEPQQLARKRKMSEAKKSGKIESFVDFLLE